jgi:predicted metalloprotease with PDZ domain
VRFTWKGFREAGWTVASSFGVEPEGFVARASLDELRHAVYLAGRDVRVRRVAVRGREVAVAIAGRAWTFGDDEFVEDVRSIVEAERAFFADDDFPFYLVSAIPVGLADPHSRSLGGTGLTRSFALFLQPDTPLGTRAGGDLQVPHVLAHEMFHHWNGGIASMEEPEQLVYWFSEGFTEFFARRLLLRAGYGGRDEFARSLNATLKDHALSPVRDAPNERIRLEFWKDRDVGRLPYLRGDLVAVLLDREIRSRSGGARSLDDFVREVVVRGRHGEKVGTDPLLRRIADWTDAAFAERVRAIVVDGAPVPLDPSTFEPCLEMRSEEAAAFDLGFDLEASRSAKETRGVRAGSAAERAGLRDGLPLLRCSITFGQADVPVEVGVRDAGAERTIRWLPRGESSPVAKLVPREGASAQDCSRL